MSYSILIVDDSLPMRSAIIKTIKASGLSGADFLQADNGQDALTLLKNNRIDIVLTDYNMPVMNGLELLRAMTHDPELAAIPVLVVSTEGSHKKIDQFNAFGAKGYINKPFTPEQIREKLYQILGDVSNEDNGDQSSDEDLDF